MSCGVGCRCGSDPASLWLQASSYSSDSPPSLGTSIGHRGGPKKKAKKKLSWELKRKQIKHQHILGGWQALNKRQYDSPPEPHRLSKIPKPPLVKRDPLCCQQRSQGHKEPPTGDKGCAVFWVRRTADTRSRVSNVCQWMIWGQGRLWCLCFVRGHVLSPRNPLEG